MLHAEVLHWQMAPSLAYGLFYSDVFDFEDVPNTTEYKVTKIRLSYDQVPRATTDPLHIYVGKYEKGVYLKTEPICGNAILNRVDPVPNTRSIVKRYWDDRKPMSAMGGGGWDITGPFDTDGLFLCVSTTVPVSGQVHVLFQPFDKATNCDIADVPEIETKAEAEPECVCKSLLWGHESGCALFRK